MVTTAASLGGEPDLSCNVLAPYFDMVVVVHSSDQDILDIGPDILDIGLDRGQVVERDMKLSVEQDMMLVAVRDRLHLHSLLNVHVHTCTHE